jgi:methyl-accepting chemotaxis protein
MERTLTLSEEIQAAIGAHGAWKLRLRTAVDTGTSTFTVSAVGVDNQCDFGKFLHTKVDPATKNSAQWRKCRDLHAQFHKAAAGVLQLALAGKKEVAKEALGAQGEFTTVSRALSAAMLEWKTAGVQK